jgi:hypothetical protein
MSSFGAASTAANMAPRARMTLLEELVNFILVYLNGQCKIYSCVEQLIKEQPNSPFIYAVGKSTSSSYD